MKALLIDPFLEGITTIEIAGDLKSLYKAIGCDCLTTVRLSDSECMFLDDVGLEKPDQRYFTWEDYHQPLPGRGVVLGITGDGDNTNTGISVSEAEAAVSWADVEFSHTTHEEDVVDFFGSPITRLKIKAHFKPRQRRA